MKKIVGFLIVGSLFACSGSDPGVFSSSSGDDSGTGGGEDGGEAGGDSSSSAGGEDAQGGGGSTSSSSSTTTSSGTGGCQPSVTCASVGAECGTIQDDGCGNQVECPDNCTGNNVCGGGGDQFKCGCTPKNCLDLGAECGEIDNGCGGLIDCGGCNSPDPYVSCGGNGSPTEFGQPGTDGQANICDGGCTKQETAEAQSCFSLNQPPWMFLCSVISNVPPYAGCEKYIHPDNKGDTWCCPNTDQ